MTEVKTEKIRFADGRRGRQIRYFANGQWALSEIVVTHKADGRVCEDVYCMGGGPSKGTNCLSDLKGATWEIEEG